MDYTQMTAPCGLDCFNCALYLVNDNEKTRKVVAEKIQMPLPDAACSGCRSQGGIISALKRTEACQVFKCISQKQLKFCFECSDSPCDHLHPYANMASQRPHNTKIFNLYLIKKMGIENWANKKSKERERNLF